MKAMSACSCDSIVTDPPYGLSFMGKDWDHGVPGSEFWQLALAVTKPGGHLLAFGGTRTYHRLACAIEDAGWEIRDCIMWVYGSGFPKSMDVAKAIDAHIRCGGSNTRKLRQTEQETGGRSFELRGRNNGIMGEERVWQRKEWRPVTDEAKRFDGWGTTLKPAWEPIIVARKPLDGTVANTALRYGTGGLNIEACRVGTKVETWPSTRSYAPSQRQPGATNAKTQSAGESPNGRWPSNLIHDGSQEITDRLPERFFYCAKANAEERSDGGVSNTHPTVKPIALMRYLCRLVTPPDGTVLDPFCGSGSTGRAALEQGFKFVGCELNDEYAAIAEARLNAATAENLFMATSPEADVVCEECGNNLAADGLAACTDCLMNDKAAQDAENGNA